MCSLTIEFVLLLSLTKHRTRRHCCKDRRSESISSISSSSANTVCQKRPAYVTKETYMRKRDPYTQIWPMYSRKVATNNLCIILFLTYVYFFWPMYSHKVATNKCMFSMTENNVWQRIIFDLFIRTKLPQTNACLAWQRFFDQQLKRQHRMSKETCLCHKRDVVQTYKA